VKALMGQFLRYSGVGVLNTALGLAVIWGLMALGTGPYLANALGYAAGLTLSFVLNRAWTFRASGTGWPVLRFLIAFAIAYAANLAVLSVGLAIAPRSAYAVQFVAIGTYSVLFFLLCRSFVFDGPGTAGGGQAPPPPARSSRKR
jgi:putative flippase GtrA